MQLNSQNEEFAGIFWQKFHIDITKRKNLWEVKLKRKINNTEEQKRKEQNYAKKNKELQNQKTKVESKRTR